MLRVQAQHLQSCGMMRLLRCCHYRAETIAASLGCECALQPRALTHQVRGVHAVSFSSENRRTLCQAALAEGRSNAPLSPPSDFLAHSSVNFEGLGVSKDIVDALRRAGFTRPAHVQSVVMPHALQGKDFILAAETGSGKTLAYLVPLMESLRRRKEHLATDRPTAPSWFQHCAIVLCPNMALCEQVVATAASLTDGAGAALSNCQIVSARQPPGAAPIDIVVSTPAALVNMLLEYGAAFGREWAPESLSQRVRHLVADEADMLVTNPSYWDPLTKFMDVRR